MAEHMEVEARLACLNDICSQLASGLSNALDVLRNNAEDPGVAHLVADSIERLGWMADRATVVAGGPRPLVRGDAEGWIFGHDLEGRVRALKGEAKHV